MKKEERREKREERREKREKKRKKRQERREEREDRRAAGEICGFWNSASMGTVGYARGGGPAFIK